MAVTSVRDFQQLVEKSRLLQPAQLDELRTWPEQEPATLAARMVQAGWLTKWQSQQLLSGNSRLFYGKYKLLDLIGQGGMGSVYKAVWPAVGRTVALKVMSRSLLKQPKSVNRFLREIRSAAAVDHPNIVHAYDADCEGDTYFLVMEFVSGQNLKTWIKKGRPLPVEWSCECIRQAALGLQHAFEQGMVHRDIKPSNLLVAQDDGDGAPLVKILDLGLARFASETREDGELTRSGQVLGTPDYIAPEQARNTKTADIRADIFSLGCTLFELITGRLPFPGDSVMEKLMARATHDAPSLHLYRADIPAGLDAVMTRMLARDPQFRFATPVQVANALAPFGSGTTALAHLAPMAFDSQAGVSTQGRPLSTPVQSDSSGAGNLPGFPADLARFADEDALRPAPRPTGLGRQTPILILAGIAAVLAVWGVFWGLLPPRTHAPLETTGHQPHPVKKHKTPSPEEPHKPAVAAGHRAEHDPERETALWVLQRGGALRVIAAPRDDARPPKEADGKTSPPVVDGHEIRQAEELPAQAFHILAVGLEGDLRFSKAEFERLEKLTHLESLSLADTRLTDRDLDPLAEMRQLADLNLAGTKVRGPGLRIVWQMKNLVSLDLSRLNLGPNALNNRRGTADLHVLRLTRAKVTDEGLKHLSGMTDLRELLLGSTEVTNEGLKYLTWMARLERLSLEDTVVGDEGLKALEGLSSLKSLNLHGTVASDAGLAHLAKLNSLETVDLSGTKVTRQGAASLQKELPNCKIKL